jgi:hypothetical protein
VYIDNIYELKIKNMFEFIFEDELIQDPTMDETGRFKVDPIEYYGQAYLDAHLEYVQSRYE